MIRFCNKCQADTERNASGKCKPCVKAYNAAWRAANPEKAQAARMAWDATNHERKKASEAAWKAENKERAKATTAAWIAANRERRDAVAASWREANADIAKTATSAWRAANPDKVKADNAAWHKANPEARRIHEHNRRARMRENGGELSSDIAKRLYFSQQGKCPCCKLPLGDDYHMDHILPIALGGQNVDSNMQLLRSTCNHNKHAKHPIDFMQQRGFLL